MNHKPDVEVIGYCLDSIRENLKFVEKRLIEMLDEIPEEGIPEELNDLSEEVEQRFQKVNNLMVGFPFK